MTNKKNRFWTFMFSLIPGAGEMYMGFFKHGISIMTLFFLIIVIASVLNISPIIFLLPIIWFYSFFHVHNLKNMPDEEFYTIEDDFILPLKDTNYSSINLDHIVGHYKKPLAAILIVIGASMMWNSLMDILRAILPNYLMNFVWNLTYRFPQAIIGALILLFGIYLIKGKKKELDQNEDSEPQNSPFQDRNFGYQKDMDFFREPPILEDHDSAIHTENAAGEEEHK